MEPRIYLDNHATTPVDPRVVEAMLPTFTVHFGNAASPDHSFGWEAEELVKIAREQVAALIGAEPTEIIFTSGATESNNTALRGVAETHRQRGNHLITVATEHSAVLDPCARLAREGFAVTTLGVSEDGFIDLDALCDAITEQTILISVMFANNEIGVLQPIREIGEIAHERGVLFHSDAVQAVGKVPVDVRGDGVDLLSLSAHKMNGPKGVGALFVRRRDPRVRLAPLLDGGGHEEGLRSGTLNVPGIVGLGKAAAIAKDEMTEEAKRLSALRDRLLSCVQRDLDGVLVNGALERRLPGNLNLTLDGVKADALLTDLRGIALSTGSACTSAKPEASHVLLALGRSEKEARGSVRIGIGRFNTVEEIDQTAERLVAAVQRLRAMAPGRGG